MADKYIPKTKVEDEARRQYDKAYQKWSSKKAPGASFSTWIRRACDEQAARDLKQARG